MGTCPETICKHRILFLSIQHLARLPQGRPQGNQNVVKISIFGLRHWLKHRITRKLLKIDGYMLGGVWQALNCLSIHATYCVIVAGASPGETKMWAAVRENGDFLACITSDGVMGGCRPPGLASCLSHCSTKILIDRRLRSINIFAVAAFRPLQCYHC